MLTMAWMTLIGLCAVSAVIAQILPGLETTGLKVASALILILAWLKARVVLSRYLGLAAVSTVGRGFGLVVELFMLTAGGLYLAADGEGRTAEPGREPVLVQ